MGRVSWLLPSCDEVVHERGQCEYCERGDGVESELLTGHGYTSTIARCAFGFVIMDGVRGSLISACVDPLQNASMAALEA